MTVARYLSAQDVAAYMRISRSMVDHLVEAGKLPRPIPLTPRLKRWDKEAIDAALVGQPSVNPARTTDDSDRNQFAIDRRAQAELVPDHPSMVTVIEPHELVGVRQFDMDEDQAQLGSLSFGRLATALNRAASPVWFVAADEAWETGIASATLGLRRIFHLLGVKVAQRTLSIGVHVRVPVASHDSAPFK
jgi:predicted DNA-binding transcriptional regulator AlpA